MNTDVPDSPPVLPLTARTLYCAAHDAMAAVARDFGMSVLPVWWLAVQPAAFAGAGFVVGGG
jgi:hypothetical protein